MIMGGSYECRVRCCNRAATLGGLWRELSQSKPSGRVRIETAVAAGLAGLGIIQAPSYAVHDAVKAGRLTALLQDWQTPTIPVHLVYPPNRYLSAKVRVFIDWAVALFERHSTLRRGCPSGCLGMPVGLEAGTVQSKYAHDVPREQAAARDRHTILQMMRRAIVLLLLSAALLLPANLDPRSAAWSWPERWNPWAPLRIGEVPNLLTRYKLSRLSDSPELCGAALAGSGFRYESLSPRSGTGACPLDNAVRIRASSLELATPLTLSCPAAVSLALWERHVLQPAARRHFGAPAARLEHLGSYACRTIGGRRGAPLSQHASADALDVAGVVLRDGRRIRVVHDWSAGSEAGAFLREVRGGACNWFDAVLSPDFDAAHVDHLHLDRGRHRVCR